MVWVYYLLDACQVVRRVTFLPATAKVTWPCRLRYRANNRNSDGVPDGAIGLLIYSGRFRFSSDTVSLDYKAIFSFFLLVLLPAGMGIAIRNWHLICGKRAPSTTSNSAIKNIEMVAGADVEQGQVPNAEGNHGAAQEDGDAEANMDDTKNAAPTKSQEQEGKDGVNLEAAVEMNETNEPAESDVQKTKQAATKAQRPNRFIPREAGWDFGHRLYQRRDGRRSHIEF
ncbi:unnamed protein product [Amoebophrya sp. A25]|nr:unnamed protein product [Amoebophrya sp. A25]|eukprot:GSA25T00018803001.1